MTEFHEVCAIDRETPKERASKREYFIIFTFVFIVFYAIAACVRAFAYVVETIANLCDAMPLSLVLSFIV